MGEYRVLLVEDNADDELLALEALALHGLSPDRVKVARDGQEAVDFLLGAESDVAEPLPRLILLDLKLPKLSGLEVLQRIRSNARTRFIPVVVFTSSRMESDIRDVYGRGANSYICKPIDFGAYSEAVGVLETYWLDWNEPIPPQRRA